MKRFVCISAVMFLMLWANTVHAYYTTFSSDRSVYAHVDFYGSPPDPIYVHDIDQKNITFTISPDFPTTPTMSPILVGFHISASASAWTIEHPTQYTMTATADWIGPVNGGHTLTSPGTYDYNDTQWASVWLDETVLLTFTAEVDYWGNDPMSVRANMELLDVILPTESEPEEPVIPAPGALLLGILGTSLVTAARRRML